MHILMLSLTVASVLCVLLLVAIGLFTLTPRGRRIGQTSCGQNIRSGRNVDAIGSATRSKTRPEGGGAS